MGKYRQGDLVDFQWSFTELGKKKKMKGYIAETFGKGSTHFDIREIKNTGIKGKIYSVDIKDILSKPKRPRKKK